MSGDTYNEPDTDISLLQPRHNDTLMVEPVAGTKRANSPMDEAPAPAKPSKTQSPGINRPPKGPEEPTLGPYFHFKTTTADQRWTGSALVFHRRGTPQPELSFDYDVKQSSQVLYDDVFGMVAVRFDISMPIPDGTGDQKVNWTMKHQSQKIKSNTFHIPKWEQKWRGGFFSCNGFDESVPQKTVELLGFDNVWKHLNSVHRETPMHLLIWGGDQIYIDFIFADIPFLKRWIKFDWDIKWKHEFSEEVSRQVAEYYFNTYHETWERDEVRLALETMPSLMMWDDHDIFDGAGSYPPELHDSPVMLGLFRSAHKFRLLFQHHTTEALAASHGFFGLQSQNFIGQCGPRLSIVMPDGRSERNHLQVHAKESMDQIFQKMNDEIPDTTQHLIVVFAVPFSFIRVPAGESFFNFLAGQKPWVRKLPGVKGLNSIFDLPEFYDDLLDEWCHDSHIEERNSVLKRMQDFASKRNIRVTFFSGDVHCAAFSMFRSDKASRKKLKLRPENDPKLMYQIISSAIVNQAPSPNACIGYHYIANSWKPMEDTEESLVEMFERRPEQGKQVRHRKVMPNRNYTYFEEVGGEGSYGSATDPTTHNFHRQASSQNGSEGESQMNGNGAAPTNEEEHHHHPTFGRKNGSKPDGDKDLDWFRDNYAFDKKKGYPSTLGPISAPDGKGMLMDKKVHEHSHGIFCHHRRSKMLHRHGHNPQMQAGTVQENGNESRDPVSGLRVRMWLESRDKEAEGRQFASYETVIPNLVASGSKI